MKLTNTTTRDLGLDPETFVPAGGTLEIDNADLTAFKKSPVVKAWLVDGSLKEDGAPKAKADAKADKADDK